MFNIVNYTTLTAAKIKTRVLGGFSEGLLKINAAKVTKLTTFMLKAAHWAVISNKNLQTNKIGI